MVEAMDEVSPRVVSTRQAVALSAFTNGDMRLGIFPLYACRITLGLSI